MLTDTAAWLEVGEEDDPFRAERPEDLICDSLGYAAEEYEEEPAFFVDTDVCTYLTASQPTLHAVATGDTLRVRVFHDVLVAEEPAEGHVAIMLGGETVWEETVQIPAEKEILEASWSAAAAVEAGTPAFFHVHNHGPNSWALLELSVTSE